MTKKNKLRLPALFLLCCLLLPFFASCAAPGEKPDGSVRIVCTVFSLYDWTRVLLAGVERADVIYLESNGADVHSYEPTVADLAVLASTDLFVCVGGESDDWVDGTLGSIGSRAKILSMMDGMREELVPETAPQGADDGEEEEDALDEHIWLSPRLARSCVGLLCTALCELLPDDADTVCANAAAYTEEIDRLDADYRAMAESAGLHTVIVADRYPFTYLMADYGITAYAAFRGCSAESEASFRTVANLARAKEEAGVRRLLVTETNRADIAGAIEAVVGGVDGVEVLDSLQSVRGDDADRTSWLSVMRQNLLVLSAVLAG